MNVTDWKYYYKINEITGKTQTSQMVYEPLISPDGSMFCMNFTYPSEYQQQQYKKYPECYTEDFVKWVFDREVYFIEKFSGYSWSPEILEINHTERRIFFKWYNGTCNDLIYGGGKFDDNVRSKFETMLKSQVDNGIFKLTAYPHSHFIDFNGNIRAFDFYACCTKDEHIIPLEKIRALLGESFNRFAECCNDGQVDLKMMFKNTLSKYEFWPNNLTRDIYEKFNWQQL
jgi:hypothetical protein